MLTKEWRVIESVQREQSKPYMQNDEQLGHARQESVTQRNVLVLDLLESPRQTRLVIVSNVEDEDINSSSVLNRRNIRPAGHGDV